VIAKVTGAQAEKLLPQVEAAIAGYPWRKRGDYFIWPGPNSNSFTAYVVRQVPGLHASMPPNAVGRDFSPGIASFEWLPGAWGFHATLHGVAGIAAGLKSGVELQLLGLVAGVDVRRPALLVPAFGRVELGAQSAPSSSPPPSSSWNMSTSASRRLPPPESSV
jgi:hypothetical protein